MDTPHTPAAPPTQHHACCTDLYNPTDCIDTTGSGARYLTLLFKCLALKTGELWCRWCILWYGISLCCDSIAHRLYSSTPSIRFVMVRRWMCLPMAYHITKMYSCSPSVNFLPLGCMEYVGNECTILQTYFRVNVPHLCFFQLSIPPTNRHGYPRPG